ncbi:MAG: phosphate ABC transporter permease PstA, partial [Planctomycetes bacterium]|nr:phosphate ABC transporter permease PstA [Planctomycetota bacterium]
MSSDAPSAVRPVSGSTPAAKASAVPHRRRVMRTALSAHGEPMIWLTGGALAVALAMIIGLLGLVFYQGLRTFWPARLVRTETRDGQVYLGEVSAAEGYRPGPEVFNPLSPELTAHARALVKQGGGLTRRRMLRTGNFELSGTHFNWIDDFNVASESQPDWALVIERQSWGRFYGTPQSLLIDGQAPASEPEKVWEAFEQHHLAVRRRWREARRLETHAIGAVSAASEAARLDLKRAEVEFGPQSAEAAAARQRYEQVNAESHAETERISAEIQELNQENARYQLSITTAQGQQTMIALADVVRAYPANRLNWAGQAGVYLSRWREFLLDEPREANTEGGVFPAIFGTVVMTLIMSLAVVPFGVLAALYLREYAHSGLVISAVRIAINNLAGVPSIVFGVFGLGFFCYFVGGEVIDPWLFPREVYDTPTFGTGGVLWASLTLALLTLPVVIVATEEALAAVPGSMREGSYACGASKWQTIRRIVLPRALPGIMTGMILAMARGAGEVAPLMLVGAVKLAPE